MKALEKDRRRRYDTPDALARDVARHLNDEPVAAAAPSTIYTLRKFVRYATAWGSPSPPRSRSSSWPERRSAHGRPSVRPAP